MLGSRACRRLAVAGLSPARLSRRSGTAPELQRGDRGQPPNSSETGRTRAEALFRPGIPLQAPAILDPGPRSSPGARPRSNDKNRTNEPNSPFVFNTRPEKRTQFPKPGDQKPKRGGPGPTHPTRSLQSGPDAAKPRIPHRRIRTRRSSKIQSAPAGDCVSSSAMSRRTRPRTLSISCAPARGTTMPGCSPGGNARMSPRPPSSVSNVRPSDRHTAATRESASPHRPCSTTVLTVMAGGAQQSRRRQLR